VVRVTGPEGDGGWRVFISHTSELRDFPKGRSSYVAEVERAVSAAGHVIVDMADFPAADQPPAQLCVDRVRGCDVYVGMLGTRYGSPVRDNPEVSYTELEFDNATEAGLDRLVFLLDPSAADLGIPLAALIDRKFGSRQDAFRARVQASGLVRQSFDSPAELGRLVERSLRELSGTRARIKSGIAREQVPTEPQPVRASKFVDPVLKGPEAWRAELVHKKGFRRSFIVHLTHSSHEIEFAYRYLRASVAVDKITTNSISTASGPEPCSFVITDGNNKVAAIITYSVNTLTTNFTSFLLQVGGRVLYSERSRFHRK